MLTQPRRNAVKEKLRAGEPAYIMCVRQSRTVEIVGSTIASGHDGFYIDLQHSTITEDEAAQMCYAARLAGTVPLVRLPGLNADIGQHMLEAGAQGIIAPDVTSAEEARRGSPTRASSALPGCCRQKTPNYPRAPSFFAPRIAARQRSAPSRAMASRNLVNTQGQAPRRPRSARRGFPPPRSPRPTAAGSPRRLMRCARSTTRRCSSAAPSCKLRSPSQGSMRPSERSAPASTTRSSTCAPSAA